MNESGCRISKFNKLWLILNAILSVALIVSLTVVWFSPKSNTPPPAAGTDQDDSQIPDQTPDPTPDQTPDQTPDPTPGTDDVDKKLIVIDAGHQSRGNYDKEPLGPGSEELKYKVTSGTQGFFTGLAEYQLNLLVAQKLQAILEARGYEVVMIRTIHDVDMSNAERAKIANELNADAFIRIHANGSENQQTNGILTVCQTKNNPYNADLYEKSYLLSEKVLDEMVESTGAKRLYVWETDTMTGVNWCEVPVTIVEMGFMSNEEEDRKMATDEYQDLLALGIANGIDAYFGIIG